MPGFFTPARRAMLRAMGLKLKLIEYHLARAAIARADHDSGRKVNQGAIRYGSHLDRARMHDDKAAAYLAAGLAEYAGRSMTKGAREQRALRRRRGGIDARSKNPGAGRGRKGLVGLGQGLGWESK